MTPADDPTTPAPGAVHGGVRARLLLAGAALVARLPERPAVSAAETLGELWYRAAPARRAQARVNLGRVCEGLAATGRGSPAARRAASDPRVLEHLVRACFRQSARYYLEVARAGAYDLETAVARLDIDDEDEVRAALGSGQVIIVGMHFGAIELPAIMLRQFLGRDVAAPMELVADPALRDWFVRTRARMGIRILPLAGARRAIFDAVREGRSVGLVADRDLTGGGLPVPLFGHPAPIPVGPALLARETGLPVYVAAARRTADGRYRCRVVHVPAPEGSASRREGVVAHTAAIAATFETILADAPAQWWGAFHPIWPDLAMTARR